MSQPHHDAHESRNRDPGYRRMVDEESVILDITETLVDAMNEAGMNPRGGRGPRGRAPRRPAARTRRRRPHPAARPHPRRGRPRTEAEADPRPQPAVTAAEEQE